MTDTHAQLQAGLFPRAQRQSRHRRDGRQAAASGRPSLSRPLRHPPRQRRRLCLHLPRFREGRAPLRQARRLCASEDADRPPAQRRRARALAAARRRRSLAGHRAGQHHAGRRHGRGRQPARHRGDDRPLGIHLRREGAARQSRALQGRVPGAERLPDRGGRLQRRQAFDPASGRVFKPSIIKEIGGHRVAIIGQAFPYVPIAHPKRFTPDWTFGIRDEELQKLVDALAQQRQGRCRGAAVAQRHGRRPQARQPRQRHRRHPRRPHPRRRAAAGRRDQCRAATRSSPMPARTASFWPCSISISPRARSAMCATACCRYSPNC